MKHIIISDTHESKCAEKALTYAKEILEKIPEIDAIVINRVFPSGVDDDYVRLWGKNQQKYMDLAETYFHPLPIYKAPLYDSEILGYDKLLEFGQSLYQGQDPTQIFFKQRPYEFARIDGRNLVRLHLPFITKKEIDLSKIGDELIIKIGNFKKNIVLPRAYAILEPSNARLEEDFLLIEFGGSSEPEEERGEG